MKIACLVWPRFLRMPFFLGVLGVLHFGAAISANAADCFHNARKLDEACKIGDLVTATLKLDKEKYGFSDVMRVQVTLENISSSDIDRKSTRLNSSH